MKTNLERVYKMTFASVYPLYIAKAEKKGRSKQEVDSIIFWLTWYDENRLQDQLERKTSFETFFAEAPAMNPKVTEIKGMICGYRIEDIEDPVLKKIRYLDKLIDELAKGRMMDKILRQ